MEKFRHRIQHTPAAPLNDEDGTNWGLLQLSDKIEGEFNEDDEARLLRLSVLTSTALGGLWDVCNLRKAAAGLK